MGITVNICLESKLSNDPIKLVGTIPPELVKQ